MQINKIRAIEPRFTSNKKPYRFGYDDSISQERRDFLRDHFLNETIPYYNILEGKNRLEKYELEKLIGALYGQKLNQDSQQSILQVVHRKKINYPSSQIEPAFNNKIDHKMMEELPLWNLDLVSEKLGVYRGESLQGNLNSLKTAQKAGIQRIVDLAGYENLEEDCKDLGLEYHYYPMTPHLFFINNPMFKSEEEMKTKFFNQSRLFGYKNEAQQIYKNTQLNAWKQNRDKEIDKFIKFIQFMQKGNLYIACEWGTYTTDGGLMLNYFFNPLYKGTSEHLSPDNKIHLYEVRKLYNNLTSEHKKMLGWTKEFDIATAKKLEKLLIKP